MANNYPNKPLRIIVGFAAGRSASRDISAIEAEPDALVSYLFARLGRAN
jgi:hypothetical protein